MINVCITGHRPNKLYGYNMNNSKYDCLRKVIYNVIEKLYYKYLEDFKLPKNKRCYWW